MSEFAGGAGAAGVSALAALSAQVINAVLPFDCVVLRGLPGSGKSTLASRLAKAHGFVHLEADHHFTVAGKYVFDPLRAADAHALVVRDALAAMQAGRKVVVANTHVRLWEMAGIVGAVQLAKRTLCFVECEAEWGNIHDVPHTVIDAMRGRWEPLPAEFRAIAFRVTAYSSAVAPI